MKIRTLFASILLAGALGAGLPFTAQADSRHQHNGPYERDDYCPLFSGYRHHHHGYHAYHHGLHRKALKQHDRHYRKHAARHHGGHDHHDGHRRCDSDDDHAGRHRHHSSYQAGIGYTGHL